jgi:hypothetical protein
MLPPEYQPGSVWSPKLSITNELLFCERTAVAESKIAKTVKINLVMNLIIQILPLN